MSALVYDLWDASADAPIATEAFVAVCWCEWAAAAQHEHCALAARVSDARGLTMDDSDAVDWAFARLCAWLDTRAVTDAFVPPWALRVLDACVQLLMQRRGASCTAPS